MFIKGYGNISPSTDKGKLFCIAFTVIGKNWSFLNEHNKGSSGRPLSRSVDPCNVLVSGQIISGSLDAK